LFVFSGFCCVLSNAPTYGQASFSPVLSRLRSRAGDAVGARFLSFEVDGALWGSAQEGCVKVSGRGSARSAAGRILAGTRRSRSLFASHCFSRGSSCKANAGGVLCEPQRNKKRSASAAPDMTRVRLDLQLSRFAKPLSVL